MTSRVLNLRVVMLAVLAACKASPTTPARSGAELVTTSSRPLDAAATAAATSGTNAEPGADVAVLAVKTDVGREVLGVGEPRLRLADDVSYGGLALRARANIAVAEDAGLITIWDLKSGEVIRRIAPSTRPDPLRPTFALSPDARWLALASGDRTRFLEGPSFDKTALTTPGCVAVVFSHDSKRLVCLGRLPEIWSIADRAQVAKVPQAGQPPLFRLKAAAFTQDDQALYWVADRQVVRWDFVGSGAMTTIYRSPDSIANAVFSADGTKLFLSTNVPRSYKSKSVVVDLSTGRTSTPGDTYKAALSASGTRLAYGNGNELRVVEVGSGTLVWSTNLPAMIERIAYASDGDVLGYVTTRQLHVVDGAHPRAYESPTRFAGWLDAGSALFERAGALAKLSLADRNWAAVDHDVRPAVLPANAPAWATWVASDGSVAAEPNERHDAAPDARDATPCPTKLRVWTVQGGVKTLTMKCATDHDPGWAIGGGHAVAVGARTATVFDATSGKRLGTLPVERPRIDKPAFAREYWGAALGGTTLALISRGLGLADEGEPDPREDALHIEEARDRTECESDGTGECRIDYFITVYSLAGGIKQLWHARVESNVGPDVIAAVPSLVAVDRAGTRLLVGTTTGEIQIFAASTPGVAHVEQFHHGAIEKLVMSPDDGWVFSEDAAEQQRLWPLPRP